MKSPEKPPESSPTDKENEIEDMSEEELWHITWDHKLEDENKRAALLSEMRQAPGVLEHNPQPGKEFEIRVGGTYPHVGELAQFLSLMFWAQDTRRIDALKKKAFGDDAEKYNLGLTSNKDEMKLYVSLKNAPRE